MLSYQMNSFEDFASDLNVDDIEALDDEDDLIEVLLLNDEDEDEYMWNEMITSVIHQSNVMKQVPRPCRTRPFSGHMLVEDMLAGHPDRSYSCFRMSSEAILLLKNVLIEKNALRPTRYLSCNEQLCIFLYGISHALSNRVLAEIFQHSGETISRHYNNVLNAILYLKQDYIQLPTADVDVHPKNRENPNFFPYFKKALGAIDGSHIPVIVKKKKHNRYRNRKNFISQNVMAACSFDHTFLYVAAGWEGSASDMSVLRATLEDGKFNVPEGRFYLVDSGYANTSKFIAPYRGSRYHLGDFANGTTRVYRDTKDKYNHRHAQLRNAVEKAWGILKQRFKILKVPAPFPYKTQVKIVVACCVLHNFIARHQGNDKYFNMLNGLEMNEDEDEEEEEDPQYMVGADESLRGEQLRNRIALQLWNN